MRVTTLVFSGIIALASAQSSSPPTTTPTTTSTPSTTWGLTPAQSSQASCLGACKKGDVDCQAKCVGAPNPDAADVSCHPMTPTHTPYTVNTSLTKTPRSTQPTNASPNAPRARAPRPTTSTTPTASTA